MRWKSLVVASVLLALAGCPGKEETDPAQHSKLPDVPPLSANSGTSPGATSVSEDGEPVVTPVEPEESSVPHTIPEVQLTDGDRQTCLVTVGDAIPDGELADASGNPQQLAELRGEELTVVLFWTVDDSPFAREKAIAALADLKNDVVLPYRERGVAAISINVQNTAETARQCLSAAEATYPTLIDSDGTYFSRIATEGRMPRVYLLDADGKTLWFDLEFSPTTRRQLDQAIQTVLDDSPGAHGDGMTNSEIPND
jgi:peroxiredoxin